MANEAKVLGIYSANVEKVTSVTKDKSNGGKSRTCIIKMLDGPLKGMEQFGNRTVINGKGKAKDGVSEDETVNVQVSHLTAEQSTSGKAVYFFEIYKEGENEGSSANIATADAMAAAFASATVNAQQA